MPYISNIELLYLITLVAVIWATTGIKDIRKGWKNLDFNSKNILLTKLTFALLALFASVAVYLRAH